MCIEDKVGSTEHSDQLERYRRTLLEEGYAAGNIIPIYVQTYEQSTYLNVEKAGYFARGSARRWE